MSAMALMLVAGLQAGMQAGPQEAEVARVEVRPTRLQLEAGDSRRLEAAAFDRADRPLPDVPILWLAPDSNVVTVDEEGTATAHRPGRSEVFAFAEGVLGRAVVEVPALPPDSIALPSALSVAEGTWAPLEPAVFDRLGGAVEAPPLRYRSDRPQVAEVDASGRVVGRRAGRAAVTARAGEATATVRVTVEPAPEVEDWEVTPDVAEVRTGDVVRFRLRPAAAGADGGGADAADDPALPGRPLWAVSPAGAQIEAEGAEGVFVAEEPGTYAVSGALGPGLVRTATVRVSSRTHDLRLTKVGRGPIDAHRSGDTWVFEGVDGRDYAYVGTYMHDWMKAWDVDDPSRPVLTDSVQVDARRINDVKIHPNARLAVITREGASDRRNGIVLLDLSDPAHPSILSEYTETVTGGVHNVWIRGDEELVYACHNGTSDLHIIDISDPRNPREVGRWGLDKRDKTLHDVIVQDGYAYLSYWDDGVFILDVGAGSHGGTPVRPALVSSYRYPTGNTHVAWRHGDWLFVGDEIFPSDWDLEGPGPVDARGYVHVLDVSDLERPAEVARYEVPEAGAHNLWTEGDVLLVGYYQAGLRAVDISGELRGDLYRQGREIDALRTTDDRTVVPNWPMAWGAQVHEGHIYSSDMHSGLWVTRLEPR